jgi:hypothetical protein
MKRIWIVAAVAGCLAIAGASSGRVGISSAGDANVALNCEYATCPELADQNAVFDEYVGHDEPSLAFYSNTPGSGNHMTYSLRLPRDPSPGSPTTPGKSYQFELNGSFWFGMTLCDSQSYPEQVSTCTPDSDSNIVDPAVSPNHPGMAFMELQFYPPGWIPWPTWQRAIGASACDPTRWCAAMNIFSLLEDPVAGTLQNPACASRIGIETVNFAFLTKDGVPTGVPNPVNSTTATFTPDKTRDLFMASGDQLRVSLRDTPDGVQAVIQDLTNNQSGSMTASAANGFAQVEYDPTGTSCNAIPYNFHPMYSTSSEQTRTTWAAHTTNISFDDEIGHFENCTGPTPIPATPFGLDANGNPIACPAGNVEGSGSNTSPTDGDDDFCFPGSEALVIKINGCTETNTGFDGLSYQSVWPDGNQKLHPEPILFSSPRTGAGDSVPYSRVGFEADLPAIETGTCNRTTGAGCTLIPITDTGQPAAFYPFFSTVGSQTCQWAFGNDQPNTTNDFGKNAQWGSLLPSTYLAFGGGGSTVVRINDFRNIISNPC